MPDPATKPCAECGQVKPLDDFHCHSGAADGHTSACRACRSASSRRYYEANRAAKQEYQRQYYQANAQAVRDQQRVYREANRDAAFAHYGRACACCSVTENLTIDHVNGDGAQHRQELYGDPQRGSTRFYIWLIKQGFPPGYQTLCHPCNASKRGGERCRLSHAKESDG